MTEDQHRLYFRLWNAVCHEMRWDVLPAKDRDEWRRELHRRAFGADKSAKEIDRLNEFDAIKAVFQSYLQPGDLRAQAKQADTHPAQILWKLEHELLPQLIVLLPNLPTARWAALGMAEKYVSAISRNKYGTAEFGTLGATDLQHLFYDISRTVQTKRVKAGITIAELNRRAGLSSTPPAELAATCVSDEECQRASEPTPAPSHSHTLTPSN